MRTVLHNYKIELWQVWLALLKNKNSITVPLTFLFPFLYVCYPQGPLEY